MSFQGFGQLRTYFLFYSKNCLNYNIYINHKAVKYDIQTLKP